MVATVCRCDARHLLAWTNWGSGQLPFSASCAFCLSVQRAWSMCRRHFLRASLAQSEYQQHRRQQGAAAVGGGLVKQLAAYPCLQAWLRPPCFGCFNCCAALVRAGGHAQAHSQQRQPDGRQRPGC